jgi:hypothetical protein
MSNFITPQTLTQEEAVWLLSIFDDEDWLEGPVSWQTASRVASGNPA